MRKDILIPKRLLNANLKTLLIILISLVKNLSSTVQNLGTIDLENRTEGKRGSEYQED